jgi:heme exporter protein D
VHCVAERTDLLQALRVERARERALHVGAELLG